MLPTQYQDLFFNVSFCDHFLFGPAEGRPFHQQAINAFRRPHAELVEELPFPTMPAEIPAIEDFLPSTLDEKGHRGKR